MNDFFDQEDPRSTIRAVPDLDEGADIEIDLRADPYAVPGVDEILLDLVDELAAARTGPMSAMVKVNRDEFIDLLEQAREQLPDELRRARWLLKEKDHVLAEAAHERDEIIAQGRTEVARLVERQEVVRAAEAKARQIVEDARAEARHLLRQTEDFCDQKLATVEVLIDRTASQLRAGRQRLLGAAGDEADQAADADHEGHDVVADGGAQP